MHTMNKYPALSFFLCFHSLAMYCKSLCTTDCRVCEEGRVRRWAHFNKPWIPFPDLDSTSVTRRKRRAKYDSNNIKTQQQLTCMLRKKTKKTELFYLLFLIILQKKQLKGRRYTSYHEDNANCKTSTPPPTHTSKTQLPMSIIFWSLNISLKNAVLATKCFLTL